MGNPLIDKGVLNRLKASVVWNAFPALNVTASFLAKSGISLALEGDASVQIPVMAGIVQSPEPYLPVSIVIHLLKTQALSDSYKAQMESNSIIGAGTVWPDVSAGGLSSYQLDNMSIQGVRELTFSGEDAVYAVTCKGAYFINQNLWD